MFPRRLPRRSPDFVYRDEAGSVALGVKRSQKRNRKTFDGTSIATATVYRNQPELPTRLLARSRPPKARPRFAG